MTVTDQPKVQYDVDRKAAKISALSFHKLDKYEYLTGEYLGLKPSTVEQAKFEYSTWGKIFNKGLKEEDKKEGLLKRLENIKDNNERLLNAFSATNKASKAFKNKGKYNYDSEYAFYRFYRDFKKFIRMSLPSKYDGTNDFYTLLKTFINTHKPTKIETKDRKDRIIKHVKLVYDEYFNAYKRNYDSKNIEDKEKRGRDYKNFEIINNRDQLKKKRPK